MNNLKVAVVPSETENNITQQSSLDEVLKCSDTDIYRLPVYFQLQNDEWFDHTLNWTFLYSEENGEILNETL